MASDIELDYFVANGSPEHEDNTEWLTSNLKKGRSFQIRSLSLSLSLLPTRKLCA